MTKPAFVWGLDGNPLVARALDGLTNVFTTVAWTVTGTRGSFSASRGGIQALGAPDPQAFKPYEQTTADDVVGWAKAAMGADAVAGIEQQIEDFIAAREAEAADLAAPIPMPLYVPPAEGGDIPAQ